MDNYDKLKIPRILYDQTQFMPVYWFSHNSLYINDEEYKKMKLLSGYSPEGWILYTQSTPESFWFGAYPESTIKQEAEFGFKNFCNSDFIKDIDTAVIKGYELTFKLKNIYFKEFFEKEELLLNDSPDKVVNFIEKIKEAQTFIMSYYLLTQPQRFYKFDEELQKIGVNKEIELISTNGRSLTYVTQLRKTIVDYAIKVSDLKTSFEESIISNKEDYDKLVYIVNKFGFLNLGLLGGDYIDIEFVRKEIDKLIQDRVKLIEEKKKIDELVNLIEKRNILIKNDDSGYKIADIMGHASVIRFDLQTLVLHLLKYADNILKKVAIKNSMTEEELKAYDYSEIIKLIKNKSKADSDLIEKRKHGVLRVFNSNEIRTYVGNGAQTQIADLLKFRKEEILKTHSLKGTVASWPDKKVEVIEGKVFVITTAFGADEKMKDFKDGDILVATQTHPNLVPQMKKSLAIVTDEGGITCHAAIVSRELGKPCVIGTRLASKILKNGNKISINLKTGEIHIIK